MHMILLSSILLWLWYEFPVDIRHHNVVIMSEMKSQITGVSIDGKAGWQDGRAFVTWPMWNISKLGYLFTQNEYSFMHV